MQEPALPLRPLGNPSLHILRHPTFGCFMDWYNHCTEQKLYINPGGLDIARFVHQVARDFEDRVLYYETVEALYTACCFEHIPPILDDWRVWRTLDRLKAPAEMMGVKRREAQAALGLGGIIPAMMTPDVVNFLLTQVGEIKFFDPTPATVASYTAGERHASLYGSFKSSVVSGWRTDPHTRYGQVCEAGSRKSRQSA